MVSSFSALMILAFSAAATSASERAPAHAGRRGLIGSYEFSLHSTSGNYIGSCHFVGLPLVKQEYRNFPEAVEYSCQVQTRICKSNGVGAKQAFILNCLEIVGLYLPDGLN